MLKLKTVILGAFCAVSLGMMTEAFADEMKEDAIEARKGYYQVVKLNAGALVAMVKGEVEYDATKAKIAADNLMVLNQLNNDAFWIPGTSKEEMPGKTRALKKIWDTYPAVGDKAKAYKEAVTAIAAVADTGLDALRKTVPNLGKSCKGCHDEFRADKF